MLSNLDSTYSAKKSFFFLDNFKVQITLPTQFSHKCPSSPSVRIQNGSQISQQWRRSGILGIWTTKGDTHEYY